MERLYRLGAVASAVMALATIAFGLAVLALGLNPDPRTGWALATAEGLSYWHVAGGLGLLAALWLGLGKG